MENFTLATPALLFPAISLLLLAFTNRFLSLAKLIRDLHAEFQKTQKPVLVSQIRRLSIRLTLIRAMQAAGVLSMLVCVLSMYFFIEQKQSWALLGFKGSLVLLAISLTLSVIEIQFSANALNLQISDLKGKKKSAEN